jgi:hypothetical protein
MANTVKLYDFLTGVGAFNKIVSFKSPILLPSGVTTRMRVSHVKISDRIPNVFNARPFGVEFQNTKLRIGNDVDGWVTVELQTGLYLDAETIGAAINSVAQGLGWWATPNIPGFTLTTNTVIDRIVIKVNSTKLDPAHGTHLWIDLNHINTDESKMWYTLGFPDTTTILTDGTFVGTSIPMLDTQGTSCIVCCSLMPPRLVNDYYLPYVADVDFAGKLTPSDNVWPPGNVGNDGIVYNGPRTITQATFYVLTEENKPMIFMGGRLSIELMFY